MFLLAGFAEALTGAKPGPHVPPPGVRRRSPTKPHCHVNTQQPHWPVSPPVGKGHHGDSSFPSAGAALSCAVDTSSALGWGWVRVTRTPTGSPHFPQAGYAWDPPAHSPPTQSVSALLSEEGRMVCPHSWSLHHWFHMGFEADCACAAGPALLDGHQLVAQAEQEPAARGCSLGGSSWTWKKLSSPGEWCSPGTGTHREEGSTSLQTVRALWTMPWPTVVDTPERGIGLDTSTDPFPPTLLRSLSRSDPHRSCPAPTPPCFSKICCFSGQVIA